MTAPSLRDRIARALYLDAFPGNEGAWDAPGESGRAQWRRKADAVLAVLADADLTDLGLEQVGWFVRCPSGIEAIGLTPFTNDSDMGRQQPVYARPRPEETP